MDKPDIKEWNDKANKLKEYLAFNFPNGCEGIECNECVLYGTYYCDFIQ